MVTKQPLRAIKKQIRPYVKNVTSMIYGFRAQQIFEPPLTRRTQVKQIHG